MLVRRDRGKEQWLLIHKNDEDARPARSTTCSCSPRLSTVPELVSREWHRDRRRGLARLDYTQNAINQTPAPLVGRAQRLPDL